jgi:hypothetical protein
VAVHLGVRSIAAATVRRWLHRQMKAANAPGDVLTAFTANTKRWGRELAGRPFGFSTSSEGRIAKVLHDCESYVQSLNERFTNPKGLRD